MTTDVDAPAPGGRETVILVHGTFAAPKKRGAPQWYQPGSAFIAALDAQLAIRGSTARCWSHVGDRAKGSPDIFSWSGENHWLAREQAARALAAELDRLVTNGWRCHIVAHSHGGNVVIEALRKVMRTTDPGLADSWAAGSIVTMGTPFMTQRLAFHPMLPEFSLDSEDEGFSGLIAWGARTAGLIAAFFAVIAVALRLTGFDPLSSGISLWNWKVAVAVLVVVPVSIALGLAILAGRILNIKAIGAASFNQTHRMLVISSVHDEAWQVLNGLLAPPSRPASPTRPESHSDETISLPFLTRLRTTIVGADLAANPGRSLRIDAAVWTPVAVLLGLFRWMPTVATGLLPYVAVGYVAFFVTGFVGISYGMRAAVMFPLRALRALVLGGRFVAGEIVFRFVRRSAIPLIRMKAAGLDYFPNTWPGVSRTPSGVDPSFFEFHEVDEEQMRDVGRHRDASVGNALSAILSMFDRYGFGSAEVNALLAEIARNTTLCHAHYYMSASCIGQISEWLARTEADIYRLGDELVGSNP
jgi:hypothetical protein